MILKEVSSNNGRSRGTICVPQANFAEGVFYNFTIVINITLQTFDITVTGQGASGAPFNYKAEGVRWESPKGGNKISASHPISAGSATSYLSPLSVEAKGWRARRGSPLANEKP